MRFRTQAGVAGHLFPPGSPWSVRLARDTAGRLALEVYAHDSLVDVVVASSRGSQLLRGACATVGTGEPRTIAWGCLLAEGGPAPLLEFVRGRFFPRPQPACADTVAGWFWLAAVDGRFNRVAAISHDRRAWCRVLAADRC